MRVSAALSTVVFLSVLSAATAVAQFGRVTFLVSDATGQPVAGAEVNVECEKGLTEDRKTKKNGKVTFAFADATQFCNFRISAEGFATQQLRLKPPIGDTQIEEVTLVEPTVEAQDVEVDAEGDDFHPPANIAKMREGIPLTDADRLPWLQKIAQEIDRWREQ